MTLRHVGGAATTPPPHKDSGCTWERVDPVQAGRVAQSQGADVCRTETFGGIVLGDGDNSACRTHGNPKTSGLQLRLVAGIA